MTKDAGLPAAPRTASLTPLGLYDVTITDGFWAELQRRNQEAILPHIEGWLERTGWLNNFDATAKGDVGDTRTGREFADSEIYKYLEAVAWELGRQADPELAERYNAVVQRVAAAQTPDGYINTAFGNSGQPPRWSDLEWGHELYCVGHLIQAAVARARTVGLDDSLVQIARRAADLVCEVFQDGQHESVDGHPEIETALIELYRVTREQRYLDQAERFLARRGRHTLKEIEFGRAYFQDDIPIRDAAVFRGHAVRALYLAAGAADLAAETDDKELLEALARQWHRTIARRTYLTGGMGSRHQDEAFGEDYFLPPDRAYSETCAGVASVMLAWRLLLATGEPIYADVIERTLYNVVAASPAHDGRSFFYANTLHRREPGQYPDDFNPSVHAASSLRAPWFEVSCCPGNIARLLASLAAYIATSTSNGIQIHQYATGRVSAKLDAGAAAVSITTDYPSHGDVWLRIDEAPTAPFSITLRIPQWAENRAELTVGDKAQRVSSGSAVIRRQWSVGDKVVLRLPIEPRMTYPDDLIDAVRGCVAYEQGPRVLALESVDLAGSIALEDFRADPVLSPIADGDGTRIRGYFAQRSESAWPYAPSKQRKQAEQAVEVTLIPYHDWANRGPSTMRVWIPLATPSSDRPESPAVSRVVQGLPQR